MALAAIRQLRIDTHKAPVDVEGKDTGSQRIHIVGELEQGTIDRDRLLSGVVTLAEELVVQKVRWRIR
jgi:hypothetical protein